MEIRTDKTSLQAHTYTFHCQWIEYDLISFSGGIKSDLSDLELRKLSKVLRPINFISLSFSLSTSLFHMWLMFVATRQFHGKKGDTET